MNNDKKKEVMNMKQAIGMYRIVKAENQEEYAEIDKNGQLPDNVCIGKKGNSPFDEYYTYAENELMTKEEENEYIKLKAVAKLNEIKKQNKEINENVRKMEKYFKFFYVLAITELVVGAIAGIIVLIVNCSGK